MKSFSTAHLSVRLLCSFKGHRACPWKEGMTRAPFHSDAIIPTVMEDWDWEVKSYESCGFFFFNMHGLFGLHAFIVDFKLQYIWQWCWCLCSGFVQSLPVIFPISVYTLHTSRTGISSMKTKGIVVLRLWSSLVVSHVISNSSTSNFVGRLLLHSTEWPASLFWRLRHSRGARDKRRKEGEKKKGKEKTGRKKHPVIFWYLTRQIRLLLQFLGHNPDQHSSSHHLPYSNGDLVWKKQYSSNWKDSKVGAVAMSSGRLFRTTMEIWVDPLPVVSSAVW